MDVCIPVYSRTDTSAAAVGFLGSNARLRVKGPVVPMGFIRPSCIKLRSSFFWDVTQRRLVATDVSGHTVCPSSKGQALTLN